MPNRDSRLFISSFFSITSLISLILLSLLTNPLVNVSVAIIFYVILLVFLISFGHWLVTLISGRVTKNSRPRIIIVSVILVILLMFRSSGSLSWVDLVVLALLGFGWLFYSSRRNT